MANVNVKVYDTNNSEVTSLVFASLELAKRVLKPGQPFYQSGFRLLEENKVELEKYQVYEESFQERQGVMHLTRRAVDLPVPKIKEALQSEIKSKYTTRCKEAMALFAEAHFFGHTNKMEKLRTYEAELASEKDAKLDAMDRTSVPMNLRDIRYEPAHTKTLEEIKNDSN